MALALVALALMISGLGCGARQAPAGPTEPSAQTRELVRRAEDAERARRYHAARALYTQARDTAPDRASRTFAGRALAKALMFWGEYEASEAALVRVVQGDPDDVASWHDLGIVRHQIGDMAGSEQALRRAKALRPQDGRPRIALAALLWKQGRRAEALAEYEALVSLPLPDRVRDKVRWAIDTLRQQLRVP